MPLKPDRYYDEYITIYERINELRFQLSIDPVKYKSNATLISAYYSRIAELLNSGATTI